MSSTSNSAVDQGSAPSYQSPTALSVKEMTREQVLENSKFLQVITALSTHDGQVSHDDAEIASLLRGIDSGSTPLAVGLPSVIRAILSHRDIKHTVNIRHVQRTLKHCRTLVRIRRPGDALRYQGLIYMAVVARVLFAESSNILDLNETITTFRQLLDCTNCSPLDRVETLKRLARVLFDRFLRERRMSDLDEACVRLDEALHLEPPLYERATILTNLGVVLSSQFEMLGRMSDLETAISYHKESLLLRPDQDRSMVLYSLANDLSKLFEQRQEPADLEKAIELHREALSLRDRPGSPRRLSLVSLGRALVTRFGRRKDLHDLDEAIKLHREAMDSCDSSLAVAVAISEEDVVSNEEHALCISAYTSSVYASCSARLEISSIPEEAIVMDVDEVGDEVDVEETIQFGLSAGKLLPENHPYFATIWATIARLNLLLQPPNYEITVDYFRRATHLEIVGAQERLFIAIEWASCARYRARDPVATKEAYDEAMRLLNHCMIAYATVDSQHEFLTRPVIQSTSSSLAADAASFAIKEGRLKDAVEILEQGRTFVWSRLRGYRADLSELSATSPDVASKFQELSTKMEKFSVSFETVRASSMASDDILSEGRTYNSNARLPLRIQLKEEWHQTLDDIREIPGFRDFLDPLVFEDLQRAAAAGPVVLLNHSKDSSDALIVQLSDIDNRSVTRVPLPCSVALKKLVQCQLRLEAQGRVRGFPKETEESLSLRASAKRFGVGESSPQKMERELGSRIWAAIVEPVFAQLENSEWNGNLERIWWCPTGILGALPLHAAGPLDDLKRNRPSRYISSYTPTLSALITARETKSPMSNIPNLLFVGVSNAPGYSPLPGVVKERDLVRGPVGLEGVDLVEDAAYNEEVLKQLELHSWVHFACHGVAEPSYPLRSFFALWSGPLTLRDFMTAHPPNAGLAFLSTCQSATVAGVDGEGLPDEVLHMAAAVQLCGFQSVIGTLWSFGDRDGPLVVKEVYSYLLRNGPDRVDLTETALALHRAVEHLKDDIGEGNSLRWAPFVHIGI